jgi:arylsulfatase A-like enzyme
MARLFASGRERKTREPLPDLQEDPSEMRNLAGDPALAAALNDQRKRLRAWCEETKDTDFLPRLAAPGSQAS